MWGPGIGAPYLGVPVAPRVIKTAYEHCMARTLYPDPGTHSRVVDVFLIQPTCASGGTITLMELLIMVDACRRASAWPDHARP